MLTSHLNPAQLRDDRANNGSLIPQYSIELLDPFAMEPAASRVPASELAPQPLPVNALLAAMAAAIASLPSLLQLPIWLQATWLGTMFGLVSVASARLSWHIGRIASTLVLIVLLPLAQRSLIVVTSLDAYSAWCVLLAISAGGWAIGLLQKPSLDSDYRRNQRMNCSVWDLACLTTYTALAMHVLPRIDNPLDLLCQMAPCIIGGWTLSLLAFEWAWRDRWTLCAFTCALLIAPLACLLSLSVRPMGLNVSGTMLWLISGPASVLAMQGIITLCFAACYRVAETRRGSVGCR